MGKIFVLGLFVLILGGCTVIRPCAVPEQAQAVALHAFSQAEEFNEVLTSLNGCRGKDSGGRYA